MTATAPGPSDEPVDEAGWRAMVEQGLKGAGWDRLRANTTDGVSIAPLYREPDIHTATDVSGYPGGAPFIRGSRVGPWLIRQAFAHPDPDQTNRDILADLAGGVAGIELVVDPAGDAGVAIQTAADLDLVLADVILEAAPVSLHSGAYGMWAADMLAAKLKGVAAPGSAFNLDPIGALMSAGKLADTDISDAARFAARVRTELPSASAIRIDARPVHEAGGSEAQEIASALSSGIAYLRALNDQSVGAAQASAAFTFAFSVGPDVLVETAKLRAARLCWARVMEASGADPDARAARIHAFTSRRMMTRHDAQTNILRVTCAAFAAAIAGAEAITTYPFTDALGLPTPFARRVARNTQHVLLEECQLGHVADPAGGAWFVEKLTRDIAELAWAKMQTIEALGGIVAALSSGALQKDVAGARVARQRAVAERREAITGVTDFPLLGAKPPQFVNPALDRRRPAGQRAVAGEGVGDMISEPLTPIRWAAPFEALRERAETKSPRPEVFFATLGQLASFGPRAQFARNLFAAGGITAIGEEDEYVTRDAMIDAFRQCGARVAVICGADGVYAEEGENAAQRLKAANADWVVLAGKPSENEQRFRAAGVDQFVFTGQDALRELETLHAALGIAT